MGRLYYVDALRSFCMLFGVFLHTTTLGDFGPALESIPLISDHFRMGSFFLVSGFLAGMMIDKIGARAFAGRRSVALMVPFFAALVLLNPPTLWLIYVYFDNPPAGVWAAIRAGLPDPNPVRGPAVWHMHLWFLLSLYVYVLIAGGVLWALRRRWAEAVLARAEALPGWLLPSLLALAVGAGVIVLRVSQEALAPASAEIFPIRATLRYAPFYLLGLLFWVRPALWGAVHRIDPVLVALCLGLVAVELAGLFDPASLEGKAYAMFRRAVLTAASIFALLWLFRAVAAAKNPVTSLFGAAIYTIYLAHFLLIYVLASLLKPTGLEGFGLYAVVSLGTIALGLALHVYVVDRLGVLRFLFNGKLAAPVAPSRAA